jgi:hypothetical protein
VSGFDATTLRDLELARTVRIETSAGDGRPVHLATIWVVVDGERRLLVRSWRGERGRWYRELLANPTGALLIGRKRIAVRAELASDPARIEACNEGLRRKYASARGSLAQMLLPDALRATFELHWA